MLADLGRTAEAAGWDGFFVWDHLVYRDPAMAVADPWIPLAALAATTSRMRLGAMVTPLARRRPWKVARETASLDRLSGGRLIFGAGLGSAGEREFAAFGEDADPRRRAELLDEGLEVLSGLWTGEPFAHRGRHHTVLGASFQPTPLQSPRIPVWIAGRWPARRPFRRAARWDGVFPTHDEVGPGETMSPGQLAEIVEFTLAHRETSEGYEVAIEGQTEGADRGADGELVERYREVGLTWWVEALHWTRGPLAQMRARIEAGPPVARALG